MGVRAGLRRDNVADWLQLKRLSDKGVSVEAPREVEFVVLVRTESSAQHIAQHLATEGFETRFEKGGYQVQKRGTVAENDEGYLVWARKTVVLYGETLKAMRQKLGGLATKENGKYLGWKALDESPLGKRMRGEA